VLVFLHYSNPMITELKIENYKSIQDLTLDVGRVNVLIGENGCGKSNILEAVTLAAAAEANKLDNEFLSNRGIRVTEPQLMRSIFRNNLDYENNIKITLEFLNELQTYTLKNDNTPYSKWIYIERNIIEERLDILQRESLIQYEKDMGKFSKAILPNIKKNGLLGIKENSNKEKSLSEFLQLQSFLRNPKQIKDFIIYSPENTMLRDFDKKANIEPLGDKGEGLLKLLIVTQNKANQSQDFSELNDIQETLELFGWYETIEIPNDFSQLEKKITIKDRYLEMPFDQRSANEGFLLVLFYITLVVSKYTPKIFAIDNIDTSLNPKLCTKLIKELARLAKKYDKQLFVTSHNPAILDGIDLGDDEQRLFVVSRNKQGHTRCKRIEAKDKPKSSVRDMLSRLFNDNKTYNKENILNKFDNNGDPLDISYAFSKAFDDNETYTRDDILNKFDNSEEPVKLSYAFLRGYLGGLPKNF